MTHTIHCRSTTDGKTRFFSHDRTDRNSLNFVLTTYPGTSCENVLTIEVYEMVGEVEESGERGRFYSPLYGFSIETSRERTGGFRGTGYADLGEATVKAFARAAAYGNGGFPLDWNVDYRLPRRYRSA